MKFLRRCGIVLSYVFLVASSLSAANLWVPRFHLTTRGYGDDGAFVLTTRADIDLQIEGGLKFGGRLAFSFSNPDITRSAVIPETYDSDAIENAFARTISIKSAGVIARNVFGLPIDFSYYTGETAVFGSGDDFPLLFGTTEFATTFRGVYYFPDDPVYDGIHAVSGTGFGLGYTPADAFGIELFVYQDEVLGTGTYSADLRVLYASELVKLEGFLGSTFPSGPHGTYRAGLMMYYDTGAGGEFFSQLGVTHWTPVQEELTIDNFFLLFEPRVRLGPVHTILTFFWHPSIYRQIPTGNDGAIDINLKFQYTELGTFTSVFGVENLFALRPSHTTQFAVSIAPFLSVATTGAIWDFKLKTRVFPFDLAGMFEGIIGVRTAF